MRQKVILALLLTLTLMTSQASASVMVNGKDINTIQDILREARGGGLRKKGNEQSQNLELPKASLLRIYRISHTGSLETEREFAYDLTYGIGGSEKTESLDSQTYSAVGIRQDAFYSAAAKTTFGGKKIVVSATQPFNFSYAGRGTNWWLGVSFLKVGKDDDGKFSQSEFLYWRYPSKVDSGNSAYNKDIKTGIFVEGFDGELVVAATMEATNDNPDKAVAFSSKKVNARLDFWSLTADDKGDPVCKKLPDNTIQKVSGYETAPLCGLGNATDDDWPSTNNLNSTTASPYMVVKVAVGDLNHDGWDNEVAMVTADVVGVHVDIYQITYDTGNKKFNVKHLDVGNMGKSWDTNGHTQYTYNYPDYFRKWSYNGWNRVPGADVVTGDFDGDGMTELAVIFQQDFPESERGKAHTVKNDDYGTYAPAFGGTVRGLRVHCYRWNNNNGAFDFYFYDGDYFDIVLERDAGFYTMELPYGGIKAVTADVDGDGKDEVAFTYLHRRLRLVLGFKDGGKDVYSIQSRTDDPYYAQNVSCRLGVLKWTGSNLSPLGKVHNVADNVVTRRVVDPDGNEWTWDHQIYSLQEWQTAPVARNEALYRSF